MAVLIMILLISLLIMVHEIGHFSAARLFGVGVSRFGFGLPIGPVMFKTKWKDTEILIHWLLLGGYVSFVDDEENQDLDKNSPLLYKNKTVSQRALILSAGVLANLVCAFMLVILTAAIWGHLPSGENKIYVKKIVAPKGSAVYDIGLKEGDLISKINNSAITYPNFVNQYAQASKKFNGSVTPTTVEQKLAELKKLNPKLDESGVLAKGTVVKLPRFSLEEPVHFTYNNLRGIDKYDSAAEQLSVGQKELRNKIYNKTVYALENELTLKDIAFAISDTQSPLYITVVRDKKNVALKPLLVDETGIIGIEQMREEILTPTKDLKSVIVKSSIFVVDSTKLMLLGLMKLLTGQIPLKDLHGIVAITKIGSDIIYYEGLFKGLLLTAIISMNLAIMNLLPIPALDGGHLLFLFIEKIQGRPVEEKTLEKISNIGFIILLVLMFLILFNDIFALISKKF